MLKYSHLFSTIAVLFLAAPSSVQAQQYVAPTNFGTVAVGSSSSAQTLPTISGLPANIGVTLANRTDFSIANPNCTSGSCSPSIIFNPAYPGLRQNAVIIYDGSTGALLGVEKVYGIGTAGQIEVGPGIVSTVANRANLTLQNATLNGVAVAYGNVVFLADKASSSVYYLNPSTGAVTRFAGNGSAGYSGDGGAATSAQLNSPSAIVFDSAANLYIADSGNNVVRKVTCGFSSAGCAVTTVVSTNAPGGLNNPMGLAVDPQGDLFIADTGNNRVLKATASNGEVSTSSSVTVFAGTGAAGFGGDGGAATSAQLNQPIGLALDQNGNLFIADSQNDVIREVSGGNISTVAGNHAAGAGFSGDGGPATSAQLSTPHGVVLDAGDIYIADTNNDVIRRVQLSNGDIYTIAGTHGVGAYSGDGGPATSATLNGPQALAEDPVGDLFIVDAANGAIREVTATPASVTFTPVNPGPITLTVSNIGNANLDFTGLSASSSNYSLGGTCTSSTVLAGGASCTIIVTLVPPGSGTAPPGTLTITHNSLNHAGAMQTANLAEGSGFHFIPITPCRVVDTRTGDAFSGSFIAGNTSRNYVLPNHTLNASACPIPTYAAGYALNVTVVPHGPLGYLTVYPMGQTAPFVSNLNSDGRVKANAVIAGTGSGTGGGISVFASNDTDVVLDLAGYFVAPSNYSSSDTQFYPLAPCRVADTRNAAGNFGGPGLNNSTRSFPMLTSSCVSQIPPGTSVKAYSLNITAVPHSVLWFLAAWPSTSAQPFVSNLNAPTQTVVANAAIVQAGTDAQGSISVFASSATDVVIDINGYFAAPATDGLSLYTATPTGTALPCRVLDSRTSTGSITGATSINFVSSSCGVPSTAQAYVIGATVVPHSSLGFLSLWPGGEAQPWVSTLNASDQAVTSNLSITPTTTGVVSAFASSSTDLILDIFGYFAP